MRKPHNRRMTTWRAFVEAHRDATAYIHHHSTTKRGMGLSQYGGSVPDRVLETLAERSALSLLATNPTARIEFLRAARKHFVKEVAVSSESPGFFVTLTPSDFVVPTSRASQFDWSEVQTWAAEWLAGFDYLGIVDMAPYVSTHRGSEKVVSWHVHLIIWNSPGQHLQLILDRINDVHEAFLPGGVAAHVRAIRGEGTLRSRTCYMLKAPLRTYRVHRSISSRDRSSHWKSKKDTHRIGQALEVEHIMYGATIDGLCLAGGAGTGLLRTIDGSARERIRLRAGRRLRRTTEDVLF